MAKGWDDGTTAEVRRVASQKIAVEMVKLGFHGEIGNDEFFKFFFGLVDRLDEDVIKVGAAAREAVPNQASANQYAQESSVEPAEKLNDLQRKKMLQYLNEFVDNYGTEPSGTKVPAEMFKLKLWSMQLPNNIVHKELVKELTVEQGMTLYGWVKETFDQTPAA